MEMLDLFIVFFCLMIIGIVLVFIAALVQDKNQNKKRELDEHAENPGATAPGLPHHRSKK